MNDDLPHEDGRLAVTIFPDTSATRARTLSCTFEELVQRLREAQEYPSKDSCPLLKLARFGAQRSAKYSLRHDANVIEITGLEGDYDAEQMPITEAAMLLHEHGIEAVLYTSPSHTPDKPRWRVLAPLSHEYPPQDRNRLLARLNGALGGVLASESFTLSQSYYVGRVNAAAYEVQQVRGRCIDLLEELDQRAIYSDAAASAGDSRAQRLEAIRSTDRVIKHLVERGLVKRQRSDGGVDISCPFEAEHTGPGGRGDCTYWPPNTGGFVRGHFRCLHGHCAARKDEHFLVAIGFEPGTNSGRPRADMREPYKERGRAQRIGEGEEEIHLVQPLMTLEQMLKIFVFLSDGAQVAMRERTWSDSFEAFKKTTAASLTQIKTDNGNRLVPTADVWLRDPKRITVRTVTFAPRRPEFCADPDNNLAFNLWHHLPHRGPEDWERRAEPFLEHIVYLIPIAEERQAFLDWAAHIEQRPGELPHVHYVMVAQRQGVGRNWLGSVLARVWPGNVALNFDLPGTLKSGFNGKLQRKLLAVVDELNEGGAPDQWAHSQQLKTILTEETRQINPKYGRQHIEFNCTRWLMLSNHYTAIPILETDRRINVVANPNEPKDPEYYTSIYGLVEDPLFIASVREWLRRRDLQGFNPGLPARMNEAKEQMIHATESAAASMARIVMQEYPSDCATSGDLQVILYEKVPEDVGSKGRQAHAFKATMLEAGARKFPRRVRIGMTTEMVWVLRNHDQWLTADGMRVADEVRRGRDQAKFMDFGGPG